MADGYQKRFGELLQYDVEAELARFDEYRQMLKNYVVDGVSFMRSAQQSDQKIVIEGANVRSLSRSYTNSTDFLVDEHRARGFTVPFPSPVMISSLEAELGALLDITPRQNSGAVRSPELDSSTHCYRAWPVDLRTILCEMASRCSSWMMLKKRFLS